jgi:hypothetical protein
MTFDELINHTFSQISCLSCSHPHRDFCLAQLAGFFLAHEAGQKPSLSRDQLMRRCCRNAPQDGVTFVQPNDFDTRSPRPAPRGSGGWW